MKRRIILAAIALALFGESGYAQVPGISASALKALENSHDVQIGDWGPYSKQYAGISHIPDMPSGMRFDFSVMPGYYRNKVLIPNVLFESGYFPWDADPQAKIYGYRYELEWKDRVYVDVTYKVVDKHSVIATVKCVNNTELPQNLVLNLMSWIAYPEIWPQQRLLKPSGSTWINAVDYISLKSAAAQPKDNLVTDGLMKGEVRGAEYLDGSALGKFGRSAGEEVSYALAPAMKKGYVTLFYRSSENAATRFKLSGAINQEITLKGMGKLATLEVPFDAKSSSILNLRSIGGDAVELNGLLLSTNKVEKITLQENSRKPQPEIIGNPKKRQLLLKYRDAPGYYGMTWDDALFKIREVRNDELDVYFRKMVHNHVDSILNGNGKGHFENVFIRPVELPAGSEKVLQCLITHGDDAARVNATLQSFEQLKQGVIKATPSDLILPSGAAYQFSQQRLKAALLENVVYPIYTQRNYIRHFTPGKWWNSLYTWDSGFIALGLNETDINRAIECINAYTTAPGSQSAFIHHGSPVPVQIYAFLDLWNKTQSKAVLDYFYPRLKQYYSFLSGRLGSSSTRTMSSNLLKTWDYFYNSGGWDDYPAQSGVHQQRLESSVTPVITTAQCIRFAKILRMVAQQTDKRSDVAAYDKDIALFTEALQKYSWNSKSGYFSYVRHDAAGMPAGPFTYADGSDYNMGLDGAYPLLSGICTPEQQASLLKKIFSAEHMWTPSGIGVVDQAAPYYRKDGYWNGSVWMPHQWFMWKTMLDLGKPELAMQIAQKGLEVFEKETSNSYYTFEHFLSESGRGAGWHQFSGLSTPVLSWFNAGYKSGTLTTGFEIFQQRGKFSADLSGYEGDLSFDQATAAHPRSLMICLKPEHSYEASFAGKPVAITQPYPGLVCITLPATNQSGKLLLKAKI
ncbi:MGH1-like glycoside hydrolase domain-containing protein [Pedobacter metabolipauper]|uniref:Glycosyl hydrolase family 63 n=1 Tax=Pedobacter metabolipauper TaxID=425513 RepID=A0A4R6SYA9_9SPHI|nr:trehalase family glycosidase [Pedobacter metabolipauper]TDQ09664.1 glycosyl hydrolase family 63 [Pedobacter metabolipauper]